MDLTTFPSFSYKAATLPHTKPPGSMRSGAAFLCAGPAIKRLFTYKLSTDGLIKYCPMLDEQDFFNLPGYRPRYTPGEQVFFIPLFSDSDNPAHGIVTGTNSLGDIEVWTGGGEAKTTPDYCRPGSAKTVLAWLEMLKADAELQADWGVTVICEAPKTAVA